MDRTSSVNSGPLGAVAEGAPQESKTTPPTAFEKVVIAIHGIGDQQQRDTLRTVAHRFGEHQKRPVLPMLPLGHFHVEEGSMSVLEGARPPYDKIGFKEVFWADIPREVVKQKDVLEESKAWGKSVASRAHAMYMAAKQSARGAGASSEAPHPIMELEDADFDLGKRVLEEVVESLDVLRRQTLQGPFRPPQARRQAQPRHRLQPLSAAGQGARRLLGRRGRFQALHQRRRDAYRRGSGPSQQVVGPARQLLGALPSHRRAARVRRVCPVQGCDGVSGCPSSACRLEDLRAWAPDDRHHRGGPLAAPREVHQQTLALGLDTLVRLGGSGLHARCRAGLAAATAPAPKLRGGGARLAHRCVDAGPARRGRGAQWLALAPELARRAAFAHYIRHAVVVETLGNWHKHSQAHRR